MDNDIKVHILGADDPYADTQCGYADTDGNEVEIKDGDVLVIVDAGMVGILVKAWPVVVVGQPYRGFHTIDWDSDLPSNYERSIRKACDIAISDADVTGNRWWAQEAASILNGLGS